MCKSFEHHMKYSVSMFYSQSCSLPPAALFTPLSTKTASRSPSANEIPESLGEFCWLVSCWDDVEVETVFMLLLKPPLEPPLLALMLMPKLPWLLKLP